MTYCDYEIRYKEGKRGGRYHLYHKKSNSWGRSANNREELQRWIDQQTGIFYLVCSHRWGK